MRSAEFKLGRTVGASACAEFKSLSRVFATTAARPIASGQPFIVLDEELLNPNNNASLLLVAAAGLRFSALFLQQSCDLLVSPAEQACPEATTLGLLLG
ncbi:MAG TPA: hypothetical protein VEW46_15775 [Pyrinomonadaceae bacterium]|nr:hypothetical protein [Pyrinomonadaceae bacterium]